MPQHKRYVEPFCGSAAVFLNKERSIHEILNDVDGNIVHFFKIIRERPEELVQYLRMLPYSLDEHNRIVNDYYKGVYSEDPVQRAAEFYLLRYTQFGSKTDGPAGFGRNKNSLNSQASAFKNSLDNLIQIPERLRDAVIENRTFEYIIEQYDHPDGVFYCDPPYRGTEDKYQPGVMDHAKLIHLLDNIEGNFLLSYDHKLEREGWFCVEKDSRYQINAGGRKNTEYLYMNFNPTKTRITTGLNQTNLTDY